METEMEYDWIVSVNNQFMDEIMKIRFSKKTRTELENAIMEIVNKSYLNGEFVWSIKVENRDRNQGYLWSANRISRIW